MKKLTVIMPHHNREWQLKNTLDSIAKTEHSNFSIIVIEDGSETYETYKVVFESKLKNKVDILQFTKEEKKEKKWVMPLSQMNIAIKKALDEGAENIILQNAECRHIGDVLTYTENNLTDKDYFPFACFSLDKENSERADFDEAIHTIIENNNTGAGGDFCNAWYNHSIHRPVAYDFCAAITKNNIIKLNGYDERFAEGFGYGDDNLLFRIRILGLKIQIIDSPFVCHQWHEHSEMAKGEEKLTRNMALHNEITSQGYKAQHLFTDDFEA